MLVSACLEHRPALPDLVQRLGNKFLTAEAGIDRHDQDHVDIVQHILSAPSGVAD